MINKKGQGSFLSGDIPAIIMIVVSITFFLSSVFMAITTFEGRKGDLDKEAAIVDASSIFLKENAKIRPDDIRKGAEFTTLKIERLKQSYGVQVYIQLQALSLSGSPTSPDCTGPRDCVYGEEPPEDVDVISKRFPIALKSGATDLEVYPALVKVSVYRT